MSTPVIHTRRPISGLAEDCESFAVVRGQRIARTAGGRAPRVVKPEWDEGVLPRGSNTYHAGIALERPSGSRWGEQIGDGSSIRTGDRKLGMIERIRRRALAVVSSPGGIIVSASAILLSIGLAPVVAEEPIQYSRPVSVSVEQQK